MLGLERLAGAVLWSALVIVNWFQAQFTHPIAEWWLDTVLATWEESIKSVIRELFSQVIRVVNNVLNALFSWFPGYQSVRTTHEKPSAWQAWFEENRQGTLNHIIARDTSVRGGFNGLSNPAAQATGVNGRKHRHESPQSAFTAWSGLSWFKRRKPNPPANDRHDSSQKKRKLTNRDKGPSNGQRGQRGAPAVKKLKQRGSELFDRPAGWAVQEKAKRGFLEDFRIGLELATTAVFDAVRWLIRKALFMPEKQAFTPLGVERRELQHGAGSNEADDISDDSPERTPSGHHGPRVRRVNSFSDWESLHTVWTVGSVIQAAGYELEQHEVTTDDGYILRMERMPRRGGKDVVFFMHGILDTSMGWVSNGVTGSQAFAAYDQGFDVWLGNSRANPPREHERKEMQGSRYWFFTVNELGQKDIGAQLDFIDRKKRQELLSDKQRLQQGDNKRKRPHRPSLRVRRSCSLGSLDNGRSQAQQPEQQTSADHAPNASQQGRFDASQQLPYVQQSSTSQHQAASPAQQRRPAGTGGMRRNKSELTHRPAPPVGDFMIQHQQQQVLSHLDDASDSDDEQGYASPREDLELVSPDSSPFKTLASEDWASSAQQPAAQRSSMHSAAQQSGGRQSVVPDNGHVHQHATSGPQQPDAFGGRGNGRGSKRSLSQQALQHRAERAGHDAMQPDMFAIHGISQDPADSMSGEQVGHDTEDKQTESTSNEADTVAAEDARVAWDSRTHSYNRDGGQKGKRSSSRGNSSTEEPYRMRAVGHSLGGASLLIYAVTRSMAKQPTHLCRLILLTPAGFQQNYPKAALPFLLLLPPLVWALHWIRPGVGAACYIPSSLLRYITFKLTVDMQQIPALNELAKAGLRVLLNGDSSQWDRAMQMPHYNTRSMPSISFHTGMHIIQWIRSGRFQLYDYRNAAANQEAYGQDMPPDVAANYGALQMPIDIMAGESDGVIAKENVEKHWQALKDAGCCVTHKVFDFGHLDFTFAMKDDLRHYVLSRLRLDS